MDADHELQRAKVNQNSWKLALTKHILNCEDNLGRLFKIANLKYNRIVVDESVDDVSLVEDSNCLDTQEISSYEKIIKDHLGEVQRSATTIMTLMNCDVEFDLPLPVIILLRLSSKIGSLRWPDFAKKIAGTTAKRHIYLKTSFELIQTSLTMSQWISSALATDILPFQSFINECNLNLLEWTRMSHLNEFYPCQFASVRANVFRYITWQLAKFSLNLNLGPDQLKVLIETELLDGLAHALAGYDNPPENYEEAAAKDMNIILIFNCLDLLFLSYSRLLDAKLEYKLKDYILHLCLDLYRNFEKTVIRPVCRKNLLQLLVTIANQPHASSTTELSGNIIELALKFETDYEIVILLRKARDLGLAHRPSIVTDYNHRAHKLSANFQLAPRDETELGPKDDDSDVELVFLSPEPSQTIEAATVAAAEPSKSPAIARVEPIPEPELEPAFESQTDRHSNGKTSTPECPELKVPESKTDSNPPKSVLESPINSIFSLFVNKPAD